MPPPLSLGASPLEMRSVRDLDRELGSRSGRRDSGTPRAARIVARPAPVPRIVTSFATGRSPLVEDVRPPEAGRPSPCSAQRPRAACSRRVPGRGLPSGARSSSDRVDDRHLGTGHRRKCAHQRYGGRHAEKPDPDSVPMAQTSDSRRAPPSVSTETHQRIGTPYGRSATSRDAIDARSMPAWATRSRSNGSRWCHGSCSTAAA